MRTVGLRDCNEETREKEGSWEQTVRGHVIRMNEG